MTSLQCPARVALVRAGAGTDDAGSLLDEHVARVWTSRADHGTGRALATALGVDVAVLDDLGSDDVGVVRSAVESVADEHRGESVAVVCAADAVRALLPGARPDDGPALVEVDADGWHPLPPP